MINDIFAKTFSRDYVQFSSYIHVYYVQLSPYIHIHIHLRLSVNRVKSKYILCLSDLLNPLIFSFIPSYHLRSIFHFLTPPLAHTYPPLLRLFHNQHPDFQVKYIFLQFLYRFTQVHKLIKENTLDSVWQKVFAMIFLLSQSHCHPQRRS